jgi:hypothetical protein
MVFSGLVGARALVGSSDVASMHGSDVVIDGGTIPVV